MPLGDVRWIYIDGYDWLWTVNPSAECFRLIDSEFKGHTVLGFGGFVCFCFAGLGGRTDCSPSESVCRLGAEGNRSNH